MDKMMSIVFNVPHSPWLFNTSGEYIGQDKEFLYQLREKFVESNMTEDEVLLTFIGYKRISPLTWECDKDTIHMSYKRMILDKEKFMSNPTINKIIYEKINQTNS